MRVKSLFSASISHEAIGVAQEGPHSIEVTRLQAMIV
jgi:hypothetical protein